MDRFMALPVSGDAFLFQDRGVTILVDGGWSGKRLVSSIRKHAPEVNRIDIAVCTHADMDHAGGFRTILDDWAALSGSQQPLVRQFWFPGSWSTIVRDMFEDAKGVADQLVREMDDFIESHGGIPSNEVIDHLILEGASQKHDHAAELRLDESDYFFDNIEPGDFDSERVSEPDWMGGLRNRAQEIIKAEPKSRRAFASAKRRIRQRIARKTIGQVIGDYWIGLIDTAEVIRQIAYSAVRHRVIIRWFDYEEFESKGRAAGGYPNLLVPVNSVEQRQPPTGLLYCQYLRLSLRNEQCLAFYAPGKDWRPGVLFCGDSPLGSGYLYGTPFPLPNRSWPHPVIVTAPHHGSESNAIAYQHIQKWASGWELFWVRSGGSKKHPGPTYRKIPPQRRACTKCSQQNYRPAPVEIYWTHHRRWPFVITCQSGHRCSC